MRKPLAIVPPPFFENVAVVLVQTLHGGNIGSAARAMKNMGLSRLKLVNPQARLDTDCLKMAGRASDIVSSAQIHPTFEEAVAEENVLVGTTSARDRRLKQRFYTPRDIAPILWEYARRQRVALLFGPENQGLTDEQLSQCQYLVYIPAHPEYPVLNLAQAVMILAYEMFAVQSINLNEHLRLVSHAEREEMFKHMENVLVEIGFLPAGNPARIMRSIRRFLGRADLTERDVQIIRGMMSHMEWYSREGQKLPPEAIRKP